MRTLLLDELRDDRLPPQRDADAKPTCTRWGRCSSSAIFASSRELEIPELRDPPLVPSTPPRLRGVNGGMFDVIRQGDVLVHHPFDSFQTTVEQFIERAAEDDDVLAIKLTLYRTSGDTPIVRALTEAAESGKQVVVLVELKARFDEANNITWARQLESAGVHVVYGMMDLKTHTKTCLVVRREADGIRRYVHVGTGNYNSKTARQYTDLGLFTCNPEIGADLSDLFNFLTGFSRQRHYRKLIIAPGDMRERFLALIARETEHARAGAPRAHDREDERARRPGDGRRRSTRRRQAGVEIDLIVRGICCLRPGHRRDQRHHPRHQHRRALPRALAPLVLPQRRRARSTTSAPRTGCRATSSDAWRRSRRWRTSRCTSRCARCSRRICATIGMRGLLGADGCYAAASARTA